MNVNKTEGCLWHNCLPEREGQPSPDTARFIQLMAQVAELPDGRVGKSVLLTPRKQRYRLVGGFAAGLVCEIDTRQGKTYLKVLVPQPDLCQQLQYFSDWLNAGLLAAGHSVVLEVVYDADIS